jgi:hypothetical protein
MQIFGNLESAPDGHKLRINHQETGMKRQYSNTSIVLAGLGLFVTSASAHDPIFGIGPHVLFKQGVETALEVESAQAGDDREQALAFHGSYGLTGDWAVGIELPYQFVDEDGRSESGRGDIALQTKYRFWREDTLGLQRSAAILLKVISDTATDRFGKEATDSIIGLTYGYEGRSRYRWASARYRFNGKNDAGVERGDRFLLDFVAGWRPKLNGYREPDTVWLLELNGEFGQRAELDGVNLANTGGSEWFVSPGLFWTSRNFAIKAGVQIPLVENLNGNQAGSDYRARVSFEWHL